MVLVLNILLRLEVRLVPAVAAVLAVGVLLLLVPAVQGPMVVYMAAVAVAVAVVFQIAAVGAVEDKAQLLLLITPLLSL